MDKVDRSSGSGMTVTSRHGTGVVPDNMIRRESKDERMHVCMRRPIQGGQMRVICVFVPPLI